MAWAPDYVTKVELASYLRIDDNVDDAELAFAITGASRAVDHATSRQFGLVASVENRTYELEWSARRGLFVAEIDDLMTATGLVVTVSGSAVTAANYVLEPLNAAAESRPWEKLGLKSGTPATLGHGRPTVLVTGQWGWTTVPDTIKEATLLQASRVFARRNAPFGVAGSPDVGSELRLLAKVDPDVAVMLMSYRRHHPML